MALFNLNKHPVLGALSTSRCAGVCLFIIVLAVFVFPGSASSEIIVTNADLQYVAPGVYMGTTFYTLAQINSAGGIVIANNRFNTFQVTSVATADASAPQTPSLISLTPTRINGNYGFQLTGSWTAAANQTADTSLIFHASTTLPGGVFKGNTLWMSGYGRSDNVDSTGGVSISENIFTAYPGPGVLSIADTYVYYKGSNDQQTSDGALFASQQSDIWVVKDIMAYGGANTVGSVHLSVFNQTFGDPVIPEPGTLVLLSIGSVGIALFAWRKRRS